MRFINVVVGLWICMPAGLAQKPDSFEVSSIRVNHSGALQSRGVNIEGSRIVGESLSLQTLIVEAYGVLDFQIQGGPKWMDSERFDIQATTVWASSAKPRLYVSRATRKVNAYQATSAKPTVLARVGPCPS